MREGDIVRSCLHILRVEGIMSWRNNTGVRGKVHFGLPGSSDIFAILPDGRFLAIECKTPAGKLSELQSVFLNQVQESGGEALVIRDPGELIEYFENWRKHV